MGSTLLFGDSLNTIQNQGVMLIKNLMKLINNKEDSSNDNNDKNFGTECILAFVPVETKALYIYKENNIKNRQ